MVVTLKQVESVPSAYPTAEVYPHRHTGEFALIEGDADPVDAMVWARIEAYCAHRWTPRAVVWTVEGPGQWEPPLVPAELDTVERWTGDAWEPLTVRASPYGGLIFDGAGPYRVTATVGGGDVPQAVAEAFRRLHEYSRGIAEQFRDSAAMRSSGETEMVAGWAGKALQLSGAADLLRPYRRP